MKPCLFYPLSIFLLSMGGKSSKDKAGRTLSFEPGPPSSEELMASIIDKDPLTFLCDCGNRMQFQEIENELNALIKQEKFAPCGELINREE